MTPKSTLKGNIVKFRKYERLADGWKVTEEDREMTPEERAEPHVVKAKELGTQNPNEVVCGFGLLKDGDWEFADAKVIDLGQNGRDFLEQSKPDKPQE